MSLNRLIRQGLESMEGLVALPFQAARQLWRDEETPAGKALKRAACLAENLVTTPLRTAKEAFVEPRDGEKDG